MVILTIEQTREDYECQSVNRSTTKVLVSELFIE